MSKGMVESILKSEYHHPDILKAFRKLEDDRRIEVSDGRFGRGRVQYYYMITKEGLMLLISDDPSPDKFWKALVGFCHHSDKCINSDKFEEFYKAFINKYLKYSTVHGYSFQLDAFNNVCTNWLNKTILCSEKISLDQKLLESLAFSEDPITLEKLSKEIGTSIDETKGILSKYTQIPHEPFEIPGEKYNKSEILKSREIWKDILLHYSIIVRKDARGNSLYELSLFGIILVLTLIRYNDMNRLEKGLYYNNISFQSYFDKLASNYKNKLPLIFGKWYLLKRILKEFSSYNFDIILDKKNRLKATRESILGRGKREFYESSKVIVQYNRKQLSEVQAKGLEIFLNYTKNKSIYVAFNDKQNILEKHDYQKVEAILLKIIEISALLDPFAYDRASSMEMLKDVIDLDKARRLSRLHDVNVIGESLANEITSIYYMNLYDDYDFQVMQPMNYYSSIMDKAEEEYFSKVGNRHMPNNKKEEFDPYSIMPGSINLSPKRRLLAILLKDEDIKECFSKWISDLMNYQKEMLNKIFSFSKEIEALKNS